MALERGWLRLWVAEVDGSPRRGLVRACASPGCEWYYQSGRDPAWDEHSVGFVLLAHTIRSAFEDGMREYRFLRGGEEYKGRFADGDPGVETMVLGARLARPAGRGRRRRARAPAARGSPARPGEQR